MKRGQGIRVSVEVVNTGSRPGQEVVQLYVSDPVSSVPRPVRELKGFRKLRLAPGQRHRVAFELDARSFACYDVKRQDWVVEPGEFRIGVGRSSRDIRQEAVVAVR
jgi:beta-glucosidase